MIGPCTLPHDLSCYGEMNADITPAASPVQTRAKAANLRVSMELSRAVHGRNARSLAPGLPTVPSLPRPRCSSHGQQPSKLPPSMLYQSSRPDSSKAGHYAGGSRSSSPHGADASTYAALALPSGLGQPTDDRLGLSEVSRRQRGSRGSSIGGGSFGGSMGGSLGGRSSCHSESGYTHTAVHLSFTEIKAQKQKNLAAGLVALRDSLLPLAERTRSGSLSTGNSPREYLSLDHQPIYIPSGSIERIALKLPQIKVLMECP